MEVGGFHFFARTPRSDGLCGGGRIVAWLGAAFSEERVLWDRVVDAATPMGGALVVTLL